MDALEFFNLHVSAGKSSLKPSLIEAKPVQAPSDATKPSVGVQPYEGRLLATVGFMLVWAVAVFTISNARKKRSRTGRASNRLKQVPCRNCQFYSDNNYLKCAIHPTVALTEQAINCSDYEPPTASDKGWRLKAEG